MGYTHPFVWVLIDALKKEECHVASLITQDLRGQPPKKRVKRQYKDLQERLCTLCQDRVAGRKSIGEFLQGVGHNIRWRPANNDM